MTGSFRQQTGTRVGVRLVDCDVHPNIKSIKDLFPYLPRRWVDYIEEQVANGVAVRMALLYLLTQEGGSRA